MDPSGTTGQTLPVIPREKKLGTTQTTGTQRSTTPRGTNRLSPEIDGSSSLSKSTNIVTPESTNLQKYTQRDRNFSKNR